MDSRALLDKNGGDYAKAIEFYVSANGQLQLDALEKMTLDAIKSDAFTELTDVQKAFMGFDLLTQWQLMVVNDKEE